MSIITTATTFNNNNQDDTILLPTSNTKILFSQILFGQNFHPSAVIMAFLLEETNYYTKLNPKMTKNEIIKKIISLPGQAFFVSSVLLLLKNNRTESDQNEYETHITSKKRTLKLNKEYAASISKLFVKWIETMHSQLQKEDQEEELEFDDDLMNYATACLAFATSSGEDIDGEKAEHRENNESRFRTLTFYDSFGNKVYSNVGPQFENVGLSLWPASSLLTRYVVDYVLECKKKNLLLVGQQSSSSSGENQQEPERKQTVFIELGTGIGLSGIYFEKAVSEAFMLQQEQQQNDSKNNNSYFSKNYFRFVMTDYQDIILELGRKNLALNRRHRSAAASLKSSPVTAKEEGGGNNFPQTVTTAAITTNKKEHEAVAVSTFDSSANDENTNSSSPTTTTKQKLQKVSNNLAYFSSCGDDTAEYQYLHWGEHEQNVGFFNKVVETSMNSSLTTPTDYILVAADVIYDPLAVPDLCETVETAFKVLLGKNKSASDHHDDEEMLKTINKSSLKMVVFHTVRNPKTLELFTSLMEQKGFNVEIFDDGYDSSSLATTTTIQNDKEEGNFDFLLNSQLDVLISLLLGEEGEKRGGNTNMISQLAQDLLQPLIQVNPTQKENILRSLQGGRFYNGIFAKMADQLRRIVVTPKENLLA